MHNLEWPGGVVVREMVTGRKKPPAGEFIYCADLAALRVAATLPGKAGWVWLLIGHRSRIARDVWVTLPQAMLDEWGIGRSSKARALETLQEAGLIFVERLGGHSARVRLAR